MRTQQESLYSIFVDFANWDTSKPEYLTEILQKYIRMSRIDMDDTFQDPEIDGTDKAYRNFSRKVRAVLDFIINNDYKLPKLPSINLIPVYLSSVLGVPLDTSFPLDTSSPLLELHELMRSYPERIIIEIDGDKIEKIVDISNREPTGRPRFNLFQAVSYSFIEFFINENRKSLGKCDVCLNFFIHPTSKRCSDECRDIAKKKYDTDYKQFVRWEQFKYDVKEKCKTIDDLYKNPELLTRARRFRFGLDGVIERLKKIL